MQNIFDRIEFEDNDPLRRLALELEKKDRRIKEIETALIDDDYKHRTEMEKKDKIIDEMSELIARKTGARIEICHNMNCDKRIEMECKYCVKEYFTNKEEKEGK